ncbi:hypothetical protein GPA10_37415 [Streptomyces sp. p1417]|uniref:Uncharacterized protein n=1 Tax=Streptomyces typhae TaxID=2681492 RepID=A0A6L6X9Y7_9ACTN|nr:hypothetical protein [Streptomyces typhae]MVO90280.1 hypothetical protein [Streptomyces typhae]
MTHPHPTHGQHTPHLFNEIRSLLAPLREMRQRHQDELDAHRDQDGEVITDQYAEYEDTRRDTAIEASDTLDALVQQLERLVADPPQRAFTLALQSPGHAAGERPWLFVVNGTTLDNAYQQLSRLPAFHAWLNDVRTPGDRNAIEGELVAHASHPGIPAPGSYNDLRPHQSAPGGAPAPAVRAPRPAARRPRGPR